METIKFELVQTDENQRFYRCNQPLLKSAITTKYTLKELLLRERDCLKEEHKHLIPDNIQGATIVCISDAHTHIERLVFVALQTNDKKYGRTTIQIDGKHTFMTKGGDSNSVYDDEVYLRHLSGISGYKYQKTINNELAK